MSMGAVMMMLIPPPPPPEPWRPELFPEYEAMCHAVDKEGRSYKGELAVSGQGVERKLTLKLEVGEMFSTEFRGRTNALIGNPVTDGTYSFTDYLTPEDNTQRFGIELQSLGPKPATLALTIRAPAKSPVFAEPSEVGLCVTTRVIEGSRFVAQHSDEDQSQ